MIIFSHIFVWHFVLFLLAVINGEKAAFHSPVFAQKRMRTSEMLLNNIFEKYGCENNVGWCYFEAHKPL